ncbi:MAG: hypothetical protein V3571_06770 [Pseudodesulfovibrio sp.]
MFSHISISRIMDLIIGRQCWRPYIESWMSWTRDWDGNNEF